MVLQSQVHFEKWRDRAQECAGSANEAGDLEIG